jgi:hypothetical protein
VNVILSCIADGAGVQEYAMGVPLATGVPAGGATREGGRGIAGMLIERISFQVHEPPLHANTVQWTVDPANPSKFSMGIREY